MPQPACPAPLSAFTLQSESSTARIYCDACVRQLNTPTGFVAHMKGKTHKRIMEAKISASQVAEVVHVEAITTEKSSTPALAANRWYCSSCDQDMSINSRDEHLGSLLHALSRGEIPTFDGGRQIVRTQPAVRAATTQILAIEEQPPVAVPAVLPPPVPAPPVIPSDSFHCAPCKRTRKFVGYDAHIHSESHCAAARLLGPRSTALENPTTPAVSVSNCEPESWFCITCKVYLHRDVRESHRSSKQHINKSGKQAYIALGIRDWTGVQQLDNFWPSPVGDEEQPENVGSDQATAQNMAGDETLEKAVRDVSKKAMPVFSYCRVCKKDINPEHSMKDLSPGYYCGGCRIVVRNIDAVLKPVPESIRDVLAVEAKPDETADCPPSDTTTDGIAVSVNEMLPVR